MPICYLTRVVEFTATHRIWRADWSRERNVQEFGPAADRHEHRYQCRVTVKGSLLPEAGGVMSLAKLDELLDGEIVARFHERDIGEAAPQFADGGWLATGEALAVYVWGNLAERLPRGVMMHAVRIQEDAHLYAEYFGER
jgi:6-pyruvoyltetrahydropterin/6-carboxytetrahydropterin synthase